MLVLILTHLLTHLLIASLAGFIGWSATRRG